jgi:hypothetical protein
MKSRGGVARSSGGVATETGDLHRWCLWDGLKENLYAATLLDGCTSSDPGAGQGASGSLRKASIFGCHLLRSGAFVDACILWRSSPPPASSDWSSSSMPQQIPLPLFHASVGFGLILSSERRRRRINCNHLLSTVKHS